MVAPVGGIHCTSLTWEKLRKKELHSSWTAVHTMDIENVVSWLGATTAHRCSTYRTMAGI
jgi:hypothetical protein